MSAIILDRAHEALALGELKKPIGQVGNLQGRKIIPIPYYLLVGGAILGGIATIALTVAAIYLTILPLFIAAAACAVLSLTNAIAAIIIRNLAPRKEINNVINALSEKVKNLVMVNQNLKIEHTRNQKNPIQPKEKVNEEIQQLNHQLNEQLKEQKLIMNANKENLLELAKNHNEDLVVLQKNLDNLILSVTERGEEVPNYEALKETIKIINTDENLFDSKDILNTMHQNNRAFFEQYSEIFSSLVKYMESCENDKLENEINKEDLEAKIEALKQEKIELEKKIAFQENEMVEIKELVRSESMINLIGDNVN
jgi:hypothetical protein